MAILYRSKIDTWLAVVLVFAVLASLAGAVTALSVEPTALAWPIALVAVTVGAGLPTWLLTTTYYRLEGDTLFVSSGPIRLCVPLREIVNITPTNNPLSSPALSLDRLRIEYGRGKSVMISPRNKEEFVRNLEAARRSVV
ncbi:PH domain-containing protein [Aeromonas schubertii]|uniref:PH domain-containing protein n=2 Tax=Aeromonas TaxID=642 RepID=A0ABS7VEZ0_9GAMM|nr:PH domain-containing protein [Aeromonas schubertii]MBZ6067931.1 PH domain-containing protein [Aeromonas schubertii]